MLSVTVWGDIQLYSYNHRKGNKVMKQIYDQHIRQQVTTLFQAMEQRVTPEEMERIKAAYALADEAHKSQKRKL